MKRFALVLFFLAPILCQAQSEPGSADELIRKMHSTYQHAWYHTITFTQQTEFFQNGVKQREETWYEAMDMKSGALVIKFGAMTSGNGLIFRNDSVLSYADDKLKSKAPKIHELIVLGFSVYTNHPDSTIKKIKTAGFNTDYFTNDNYDSRPHFVVGDPEKSRFWIDAKTLLFTKLEKKTASGKIHGVEFKEYQKLGKGWIETEVIFSVDGQMTMREVYQNIQSPKSLSTAFYNQSMFSQINW